jgi:hypothetical protein
MSAELPLEPDGAHPHRESSAPWRQPLYADPTLGSRAVRRLGVLLPLVRPPATAVAPTDTPAATPGYPLWRGPADARQTTAAAVATLAVLPAAAPAGAAA